jgi:hypothetical protein
MDCHKENNCAVDCHKENYCTADCQTQESRLPRGLKHPFLSEINGQDMVHHYF